jgi:hypothetical protein
MREDLGRWPATARLKLFQRRRLTIAHHSEKNVLFVLTLAGHSFVLKSEAQLSRDVVSVTDQSRTVSYESVRPLGNGIARPTRNGENVAPLIESQSCRAERSTAPAGLHHHDGMRQSGDNAVAARKMKGEGGRPEGILCHDGARASDRFGQ